MDNENLPCDSVGAHSLTDKEELSPREPVPQFNAPNLVLPEHSFKTFNVNTSLLGISRRKQCKSKIKHHLEVEDEGELTKRSCDDSGQFCSEISVGELGHALGLCNTKDITPLEDSEMYGNRSSHYPSQPYGAAWSQMDRTSVQHPLVDSQMYGSSSGHYQSNFDGTSSSQMNDTTDVNSCAERQMYRSLGSHYPSNLYGTSWSQMDNGLVQKGQEKNISTLPDGRPWHIPFKNNTETRHSSVSKDNVCLRMDTVLCIPEQDSTTPMYQSGRHYQAAHVAASETLRSPVDDELTHMLSQQMPAISSINSVGQYCEDNSDRSSAFNNEFTGGNNEWHQFQQPMRNVQDDYKSSGDNYARQSTPLQPNIDANVYAMGKCSKRQDGRKPCPLPGCNTYTYNPSQHLHQEHKIEKDIARVLCNQNKVIVRQQHRPRNPSGRLVPKYSKCPTCGLFYTRLDKHMNTHKTKEAFGHLEGLQAPSGHVDASGQVLTYNDTEAAADHLQMPTNTCMEYIVGRRMPPPTEQKDANGVDSGESDENCDLHLSSSGEEDELIGQVKSSKIKYTVDIGVHQLLTKLKNWLSAPCGGSLSPQTVAAYVSCCGRCIQHLGGTIESIKNYETIGEEGGFMKHMTNEKRSSRTIRVHIYGMLKLVQYLKMKRHPVLTDGEADRAHQTLQNYASSLKKEVKLELEERKRVSAEQVDAVLPKLARYTSMPHYEKAKSACAQTASAKDVTEAQYQDIKAHLITMLLKQNGHRTGVITNCLMSEYRSATKMGTSYQISVSRHKTAIAGASILTITNDVWTDLVTYAFWRSQRVSDQTYLFPTRNGTPMQSNNIIRCLHIALGIKTTVNTIRQLHVTLMYDEGASDEKKDCAAGQMGHTVKTQKTYYEVVSRKKKSAQATIDMAARLDRYAEQVCILR